MLLKSLDIYSCGTRELRSLIRTNLTWPLDIIAWPFYRGVVKFLWQSQRPTERETGWAWLPPGFLYRLGLQLCSWIAMWEQQSFHGASLICNGLLLALNQCQLSTDSPSVQLTGEAAIQFTIATKKNVPTGVIFDQIFKFRTLLEASSLEGYFSCQYQTWNDGMTDVQRPPTLTLRSVSDRSR